MLPSRFVLGTFLRNLPGSTGTVCGPQLEESPMSVNGKSATISPPVVDSTRQVVSNTGINRRTFSRIPTVLEMPNLVQVQIESFNWFLEEGLKELLEEISPISDHHRKMELYITDPRFEEPWKRLPTEDLRRRAEADPRVAEIYCRDRDLNYAAPLFVSARLVMRET